MDNKLYKAFGVATRNNITKTIVATDLVARLKQYSKDGFKGIELVETPSPMNKLDGFNWLKTQAIYADASAKEAIDAKLADLTKLAKSGEVKVQAKAPVAKVSTTVKEVA